MKFKAAISQDGFLAKSDIPLVVHALRVLEKKGSRLDAVLRLGPDSVALAHSTDPMGEPRTQSVFRSERLFSEFRIESKRKNLIDLAGRVTDLLRLFQLFARSAKAMLRLAPFGQADQPVLTFEVLPYDFPGQFVQLCSGEIEVRVLTDSEARAIHEMPVPTLQEALCESTQRLSAMHSERLFTDARLMVGSLAIPVHRAVIAAASPVMCRMLQSEMQEGENTSIRLPDTTEEAAAAFVDFVYGQPFKDLDHRDLADLFSLAHFYHVASLMRVCKDRMFRVDSSSELLTLLRYMQRFREDPAAADVVQCLSEVLWQRAAADRGTFMQIMALEGTEDEPLLPRVKRCRNSG